MKVEPKKTVTYKRPSAWEEKLQDEMWSELLEKADHAPDIPVEEREHLTVDHLYKVIKVDDSSGYVVRDDGKRLFEGSASLDGCKAAAAALNRKSTKRKGNLKQF
jgi:hypothetical protein